MILLVDMCGISLRMSTMEFVRPVEQMVLERAECAVVHRTRLSAELVRGYDKAILCGNALKDNDHLNDQNLLYIIRNIPIPILGICAGMQSISLAYGGAAYEWCDIGLKNISVVKEDNLLGERRVFQGYHLHSHGVTLPENFVTLAEKDGHVMAFRSVEQEIYGVLFHPEVRNEWIIENFLKM